MTLDQKTEITLAAQILAGLLSTGHFTQPNPKSGELLRHMVKRFAPGADWQAQGYWCENPSLVVDNARVLLAELNVALEASISPVHRALGLEPANRRADPEKSKNFPVPVQAEPCYQTQRPEISEKLTGEARESIVTDAIRAKAMEAEDSRGGEKLHKALTPKKQISSIPQFSKPAPKKKKAPAKKRKK